MIEVHVVHLQGHDPPLEGIMRLLRNEPVRIRVVAGIPGRLGLARARAFAAAKEPWVGWVDPDDQIEPGLFRVLREAITPEARMVHCWEWEHPADGGQPKLNCHPHHGIICRRDAVLPLLDDMARRDFNPEIEIKRMTPRVTVPWPGYHWHRRAGSQTIPLERGPARE